MLNRIKTKIRIKTRILMCFKLYASRVKINMFFYPFCSSEMCSWPGVQSEDRTPPLSHREKDTSATQREKDKDYT